MLINPISVSRMSHEKLSRSRLSVYSQLKQSKWRRRHGLFIAEGEKCVADTINNFELCDLLLTCEGVEKYAHYASEKEVKIVTPGDMRKISSLASAPDILAVYKIPAPAEIEPNGNNLYLLIDGVQDPGNLGTMVRLADWFGVAGIICSHTTVDIYNSKSVQATMGAISHLPITYCNLETWIERYPDIPVYGTFLDGDNIYSANLTMSAFIIMGSEGNGISSSVGALADHRLLIPPYPANRLNGAGCSESLNVAMATAIILSEFRRLSF